MNFNINFIFNILYDKSYLISIMYYSYKQQKFNLFREESEGYAKLITDLNQVRICL